MQNNVIKRVAVFRNVQREILNINLVHVCVCAWNFHFTKCYAEKDYCIPKMTYYLLSPIFL